MTSPVGETPRLPLPSSALGSLRYWFEVVTVLVERDHKARYRSAVMGMFWAVASPILFLLTFYFLFSVIMRVNIPDYASFVFIGIVAWNWLQTSLNEGVSCISYNASLVSHPGFPRAALPMVSVISNLINMLYAIPFLILVVLFEKHSIEWNIIFLPLIVGIQFILQLSLVFFLTASNVKFRDVQHILPVVLQLGYFMTPIFYDLKQAPENIRSILTLNPMYQIITAYRAIFDGAMPDWPALVAVLGVSLLLLATGYQYFRRTAEDFLEEI